ncbi:MAG TPA: MFS transporter [Caulobacteraceae bacterium]
MSPDAPPVKLSRRSFGLLFAVSIVVAIGNTGLLSVLPAIGREIGIPDPMVAAIFSLSALLWAIGSPYWARQSDTRGRKPMILLGLGGFVVSMFLCGLVVSAGLHKLATPMVIFFCFLLARAIFGMIGSASNPAAQAYMAERTSRTERTQMMALLAGAFGLGTVIGPAIAPLFVLPIVTLAGPLYGFALAAFIVLVLVHRLLPENDISEEHRREFQRAPLLKGERAIWRDPRVAPFLIYGFLVALCQTVQTQTLGFMIIDKLQVAPLEAQGYTAVAMMAGAVAGLLAQWGLIRMFSMGPTELLRWGAGLAAGANLVAAFAPNYWTVVIAYSVASLGYAFARPGFSAGASLAVEMREQARVAGAISSIFGLNVIFAPLFVLLYEHVHAGPFLLNMAILAGLFWLALGNPVLKNAGERTATDEEAAASLIERRDEGGF